MKVLREILYKAGIEEVSGDLSLHIEAVCFDSRKVEEGTLFVATRGLSTDGHNFLDMAIAKGAVAVVVEELPATLNSAVTYVKVRDTSLALAYIAANFYDQPSSKLRLIGVTGTNGKTTTVTLLYRLFRQLGFNSGLLSTVRNLINDEEIPSTHTTPDPVQLNYLLSRMVTAGCEYCFMEVSSHAVVQHRVAGLEFAGGVFTNITRDHLDYHKTFDNYLRAKKGFFDMLGENAFALVNTDDRNGRVMVQNTKAQVKSYALKNVADFKGRMLENTFAGLLLNVDGHDVLCRLVGSFNAYNVLAVYATALLEGQETLNVLTAISLLTPPEGRFEYIRGGDNITGIVDYAHTPDALQNVLLTVKDIREGYERVITVVGCGGDRDAGKRPQMAAIACELSDQVILTSDNPRSEDPEVILAQMKEGVPVTSARKVLTITDRREAIRTACSLAKAGDIILVAGKGHEKYQEIKGVKYPFDDRIILEEALKQN
jgi:UDP-N-acetylmuramoyl-L-alanyl-D-glutamate--2,6-diaminopimelate ligase